MGVCITKFLKSDKFDAITKQLDCSQIVSTTDVATILESIFGGDVKGDFLWYRRAGKTFFRCEHDEGIEYSQVLKALIKIVIEK